jgi:TPR repeat protein
MKRVVAGMVLGLSMGAVCADELADAAKALELKNYSQAVAIYTQQANVGNAEAALRLGEMYWYGDGAPLDRAKADALFAQAAAAGNPAAIAATSLSSQRQQRLAEITYWTSNYDGADLVAGKFDCAEPEIPKSSDNKRAIQAVSVASESYVACFNGFIDNLADAAMPPGKRIPKMLALLMSEQEFDQAKEHLVNVYRQVAARGRLVADRMVARRAQWMVETVSQVKTEVMRRDLMLADMERERGPHRFHKYSPNI